MAQGYQAGSLLWAVSFSRRLVPTSEHLGDGTETMCRDESTESRAGSVEVRTPHFQGPAIGLMLCCCHLEIPNNSLTRARTFHFVPDPENYIAGPGNVTMLIEGFGARQPWVLLPNLPTL